MFYIVPIKGYIDEISGFYCDGVKAKLKKNKLDCGFIYSDSVCDVVAIFTKNKFKAAPLLHFLNYAKNSKYKNSIKSNFLLINSKIANAMTSKEGLDDINTICDYLKSKYNFITNPISSSTGIIGQRLEVDKIKNAIDNFNLKASSPKTSKNLCEAILTTDKFIKHTLYEVKLSNNKSFKIGAVAKGAGMINPSMATMLCFICTDANVPQEDAYKLLKSANKNTFNAISVDGETSTNDSVFLISNGKSNAYDKDAFKQALKLVMRDISMDIIKDGEGSSKCVSFCVNGAKNKKQATKVAKMLSNSLLVKTALFGEDANWGRIAASIGASGIKCDESKLSISFGDITLYNKGRILSDKENEAKAKKVLQQDEIKITCDLGVGEGSFVAYGCDLGYEYIKINSDYRT